MRVNDSNNRIQDAANIQPSNTNTNQSSQSSLPKVTRLETALPATNRLIENQLGASLQKASLNSSLNQQGNITLASAQTSGASDSEKNQLILDLAQIGLSIAGVFDPTPISDGVDGAISLFRGDLLGAGISVASMIPYLGDLAKVGKLPKFLKVLDRAVDIAKVDPRFAERIKPLLQKVDDAVRGASIDSLPGPIKDAIVKMRSKLDEFFAAIPSHTKPTGAPGGTPTGVRVRINPKDAPENIRALTRQNDSADALARNGYKTDQLRESPTAGGKQPDYRIEGRVFDHFAPTSPKARNISATLEQKINTGQADRFVLNLDDSAVSLDDLRKQFTDYPPAGLKEIIIVKGGQVIPFFPFN